MHSPHTTEIRRAGGLELRNRPLRCMSDLHLRVAHADIASRPVTPDTERALGLIFDEVAQRNAEQA